MPEPLRSTKQSRLSAKSRAHPYARPITSHRAARDIGLQPSSSLLGTLKSLVTAPLTWLSSGDNQKQSGHVSEDSSQKRKVVCTERGGTPPKAKRVRLDSPDPEEEVLAVGYLDPPSTLLASRKKLHIPLWDVANGVPPARAMSVDQRPADVVTHSSPFPPTSVPPRGSMSIEPGEFFSTRRSITRDRSMPPPSPFARSFSRASVTPQPAGATFGPSPKRKIRNSTAPPLIPVPIPPVPTFTRPPTSTPAPQNLFRRQASRDLSEGPIMSLLSQTNQPMTLLPEKSISSMLIGTDIPPQRTLSKAASHAERTFASLESYRTPLTNPRFPSQSYPEDRRPRKVHVPLPSTFGFDHGPQGKKKRPAFIGPYSTERSGMRRLLQRRKQELEEEQKAAEKDGKNEGTAEVDVHVEHEVGSTVCQQDEISTVAGNEDLNNLSRPLSQVIPKSDVPARSSKAGSYLGLRAPNSTIHRLHPPAVQLKTHRNKFSLNNDEDDDVSMSVEDLKKYQAKMQATLANNRRMSEAGMQTDISAILESPRLPAQPQSFDSLLSRIGPPVSSSKPAAEFPPPKVDSEVQASPVPQASTNGSSAPATLPFSFGASSTTPAVRKPTDDISSPFVPTSPMPPISVPSISAPATGGIPAFFANTKLQFTPPSIPTDSLFGGPSATSGGGLETAPTVFGAQTTTEKQNASAEEKQPEERSKLSTSGNFGSSGLGGIEDSSAPPTASTPALAEAPEVLKPAFSLSTEAPKTLNIFGAAKAEATPLTKAAEKPAFSFGTPSVSTPATSTQGPQTTPSTSSFSFGGAAAPATTKPSFLFDQSKPRENELKPSPTPTSFTFNATPSTPPPPAPEKEPFAFGVTPSLGSNNAVKSAFGGFGNAASVPPVPSTPDNNDRMEINDRMEESPTRSMDKKNVPTISLPHPPPFASFGAGGGDSANTAFSFAPKPSTDFSFGDNKAAVPAPASSPFTFGQPLKTTPVGFSGFGARNAEASATGSGFSFGSKPNEQPSFGSSNNIPFGTSVSTPAFTFGGGNTTTGTTSFGAPINNATTSLFGQSTNSGTPTFGHATTSGSTTPTPFGQPKREGSASSSAPNSPSLFPQATLAPSPSFAFSLPSSTGTSTFGAPKADGIVPSTSTSTSQPFQFGAGVTSGFQQPQGTQPSGALFNIGAATSTPTRKVKGLPTRRTRRP